MDLHLKVQEVKYFNPFTRKCGNIQYIASVCLRRLLEFYTDIENYKLHRISFQYHYIYIYIHKPAVKKTGLEHTNESLTQISTVKVTCSAAKICIKKHYILLKYMYCNYISSMGISFTCLKGLQRFKIRRLF